MVRKEILVLAGSPRKQGNSDMMADAFIQGAEQNGHAVTKIYVTDYKIGGCRGCEKCWSDGTHCVQKDDMRNIYPVLEKASVLVYATPLYFYSWPAQIKAVLDRTFTYISPLKKAKIAIKETVLLVAAETKDEADIAGLVDSYRISSKYCGWKDRGILLATGVYEKGSVRKGDWLERATALGMSI